MEDFITILLDYLSEHRPFSPNGDYVLRRTEESAALDALCQTFSPEQNKLFLTYEDARNAIASLSEDDFARAAFLLAREIYR